MTTIVEPDARKRVSLARLDVAIADTYLATVDPAGRIILEPAVVMTALEAALLADVSLRSEVAASIDNPGPTQPRRVRNDRPRGDVTPPR